VSGYGVRLVRFILAHREAFESAYLDQSHSSSHELQRFEDEYRTLPPRHNCSCRCPNEARGWGPCPECRRLAAQRATGRDIPLEMGRSPRVTAPMPSPIMLDLDRAIAVVGADNPVSIARYMSLNGTSLATVSSTLFVPAPPLPELAVNPPTATPVQREENHVACTCLGFQLGGAGFCQHGTTVMLLYPREGAGARTLPRDDVLPPALASLPTTACGRAPVVRHAAQRTGGAYGPGRALPGSGASPCGLHQLHLVGTARRGDLLRHGTAAECIAHEHVVGTWPA
jgi:hypothetical protein